MNRLTTRLGLATLPALVLACAAQPPPLPSRDFDRPTDLTFVCMGAFDTTPTTTPSADGGASTSDAASSSPKVVSGRPMRFCHPRTAFDPPSDDEHHTYAFLPNSSSGQLGIVDADTWQLVDLDLANAGYNQSPLGILPTQISASDDGCRLVTANQGSCDLSVVDPAALLTPTLAHTIAGLPTTMPTAATITATPVTAGGTKLHVAPGEVAFLPRDVSGMTDGNNLCPADGSWQAVVTFPSCGLVALLDLPSGRIIDSVYVKVDPATNAASIASAGANPVCPMHDCRDDDTAVSVPDAGLVDADVGDADAGDVDAGADAGAGDVADAGADAVADSGASDTAEVSGDGASGDASASVPSSADAGTVPLGHPSPIAISPFSTGGAFRTYVGLADSPSILRFDVSSTSLGFDKTPLAPVALTSAALGTNRLRLSIDPYADKPTTAGGAVIPGNFVGNTSSPSIEDRKYLYAIARDGTVRVVWVAPSEEVECDTNVDPLHLPAGASFANACIPVGSVVPPAQDRPTALGPGIRLATPAIDIAVADIRPQNMPDHSETSVAGAYAWVVTASGAVYLVNIDPVARNIDYVKSDGTPLTCPTPTDTADCQSEDDPPLQAPAPNSLRNSNFVGYTQALDPSSGPPRVDILPTSSTVGPRIELVWTLGSAANATALAGNYLQTPFFFPDPSAVHEQEWAITWEGDLLGSPRFSGQITSHGSEPFTLDDSGGNFCNLGLQPNDLVTIHGCVDNTQCGIGMVCVVGSNGTEGAGDLPINGLCLPATMPDPQGACAKLLKTVRRYDITSTSPTSLGLVPHKDEVVYPALSPCGLTLTNDGGAGGGGSSGTGDAGVPGSCGKNPDDPSTDQFTCTDDHRCLDPCPVPGDTEKCRPGRICVAFKPDGQPDATATPTDCTSKDKCFCADAPDLGDGNYLQCLGQLFGYNVGIGRGFLVTGSQTGLPPTQMNPVSGGTSCAPIAMNDPRNAMRISMDAPTCADLPTTPNPASLDNRCDPDLMSTDCTNAAFTKKEAADLYNLVTTSATVNPCLFPAGPNESDPFSDQNPAPDGGMPDSAPHVAALFRNNEVQFMITNLEQPPPSTFQLRVDVHGGFRAQTVTQPSTVELTMPARLVLGPVDSVVPQSGTYDSEVPYLFVVDQRRLGRSQGGGPTRGQLLRINPRGLAITTPAAGAQPWFEDLEHSNDLFPIQ